MLCDVPLPSSIVRMAYNLECFLNCRILLFFRKGKKIRFFSKKIVLSFWSFVLFVFQKVQLIKRNLNGFVPDIVHVCLRRESMSRKQKKLLCDTMLSSVVLLISIWRRFSLNAHAADCVYAHTIRVAIVSKTLHNSPISNDNRVFQTDHERYSKPKFNTIHHFLCE